MVRSLEVNAEIPLESASEKFSRIEGAPSRGEHGHDPREAMRVALDQIQFLTQRNIFFRQPCRRFAKKREMVIEVRFGVLEDGFSRHLGVASDHDEAALEDGELARVAVRLHVGELADPLAPFVLVRAVRSERCDLPLGPDILSNFGSRERKAIDGALAFSFQARLNARAAEEMSAFFRDDGFAGGAEADRALEILWDFEERNVGERCCAREESAGGGRRVEHHGRAVLGDGRATERKQRAHFADDVR